MELGRRQNETPLMDGHLDVEIRSETDFLSHRLWDPDARLFPHFWTLARIGHPP